MKKMNKFVTIVIIILTTLVMTLGLSSCEKHVYKIASQTYYLYLDTISSVAVEFDEKKKDAKQVENELKGVESILLNIEKEFSVSQTYYMKREGILESTLMKVNANSGKSPAQVSQEFIDVLKTAQTISELTSGGFDITIGPLTKLWDISQKSEYCQIGSLESSSNCRIPTEEEINEVLPLIDYQLIEIDEENSTVFLPEAEMMLDLGGIAKGYAADKVMAYLKTLDYEYISVNLGGNLIVAGVSNIYAKRGEVVSTEIANPFGTGTIISTTKTDMTVVSSGTYERYIEVNNQKYHHILNPKDGYPYDNNLVMISIIGESSCLSDGLSTGIFSLGLEDGIALVKTLENYSAFFVTNDKEIYVVGDIEFNLTETGQKEYTLKKVE